MNVCMYMRTYVGVSKRHVIKSPRVLNSRTRAIDRKTKENK